jgi:hypothetical protein
LSGRRSSSSGPIGRRANNLSAIFRGLCLDRIGWGYQIIVIPGPGSPPKDDMLVSAMSEVQQPYLTLVQVLRYCNHDPCKHSLLQDSQLRPIQ